MILEPNMRMLLGDLRRFFLVVFPMGRAVAAALLSRIPLAVPRIGLRPVLLDGDLGFRVVVARGLLAQLLLLLLLLLARLLRPRRLLLIVLRLRHERDAHDLVVARRDVGPILVHEDLLAIVLEPVERDVALVQLLEPVAAIVDRDDDGMRARAIDVENDGLGGIAL